MHPTLAAAQSGNPQLGTAWAGLSSEDQNAINREEYMRAPQSPAMVLGPDGSSSFQPASDTQAGLLGKGTAQFTQRQQLLDAGAMPGGGGIAAALRALPIGSTAADPLRALFIQNQLNGERLGGLWLDSPNYMAMAGMRPEGNAQDAVTASRNLQSHFQATIEDRLRQGQSEADLAERVAGLNAASSRNPAAPEAPSLPTGGPEGQSNAFNLGSELVDQTRAARKDAFATAGKAWSDLRDGGALEAQTSGPDTAAMYRGLSSWMQDRLQASVNPKDLPLSALSPLYRNSPLSMFDPQRNLRPEMIGTNEAPGPNAFYTAPTLDQLKSVDNALAEQIRQEQDRLSTPGFAGSALRLKLLQEARGPIFDAMDANVSGSGNSEALRSAMNLTAIAHNNFSDGTIGQLLSTAPENWTASNNPANVLGRFFANSNSAIQAGRDFRSAFEQRTGAADARANVPGGGGITGISGLSPVAQSGASPADQAWNTFADWHRQQYLNVRGDLGLKQAGNWLANRAGMFSELGQSVPQMKQLQDELQSYQRISERELPKVSGRQAPNPQDLNQQSLQELLGGEAGPNLNAVLGSSAPYQNMKNVVRLTQSAGDGGAAFRGLQDAMFGRILHEGKGLTPDGLTRSFRPAPIHGLPRRSESRRSVERR